MICVSELTGLAPLGSWGAGGEVPYIHSRVEPSHHSVNSVIEPSGLDEKGGSQLGRKRFTALHWFTLTTHYL